MGKKYACPFCKKNYLMKDPLYLHLENIHTDQLCGMSGKHLYFNFINRYDLKKEFGKSVISGKPTNFNEKTGRYERFRPEEKEAYRAYFLNNMKRAGKENLMKDMEHQKEMLAHRKISGTYKWSDGTLFTYTGTYEKRFLEYLDVMLSWPSSDIMAPAPQLFPYKHDDGSEHVHIPDFYISSLNLIINIKSNTNNHYRLRDFDIERAQDSAIKKSKFNYLKIYENDFNLFDRALEKINSDDGKNIQLILETVQFENYLPQNK